MTEDPEPSSSNSLQRHVPEDCQYYYKCTECDREYKSKKKLKKHRRKKHKLEAASAAKKQDKEDIEWPYKCVICNKGFSK